MQFYISCGFSNRAWAAKKWENSGWVPVTENRMWDPKKISSKCSICSELLKSPELRKHRLRRSSYSILSRLLINFSKSNHFSAANPTEMATLKVIKSCLWCTPSDRSRHLWKNFFLPLKKEHFLRCFKKRFHKNYPPRSRENHWQWLNQLPLESSHWLHSKEMYFLFLWIRKMHPLLRMRIC